MSIPTDIPAQQVLDGINELRQWMAEIESISRNASDFAFEWAAQNGGVPKTQSDMDRFRADYLATLPANTPTVDEAALQSLEQRYQEWASQRNIATTTAEDMAQFDAETRSVTQLIESVSGFSRPRELVHLIAERCEELSGTALAWECDDSVVAALRSAAALTPDIMDGRAILSDPSNWTEARLQANQLLQSESICGIPLHRALSIAIDQLEAAARRPTVANQQMTSQKTTDVGSGVNQNGWLLHSNALKLLQLTGDYTSRDKSKLMARIREMAGDALRCTNPGNQWIYHPGDWQKIVEIIRSIAPASNNNSDDDALDVMVQNPEILRNRIAAERSASLERKRKGHGTR